MTCPECYPGPYFNWREQPMNEQIRKRLTIQRPKVYYLSFEQAARAWGDAILPGLNTKEKE